MFKFSVGQMASLNRLSVQKFHQRLAKFLREEIPEATESLSDESLLAFIKQQSKCASELGIKSEAGITQFACLAFAIGDGFHRIPEIARYMELSSPSAEERLDELVNILHRVENTGHANALACLMSEE